MRRSLKAPPKTPAISRDWTFFIVSLCLWCFMPEVRRLLDWRSGGFQAIQILSIVPLLSVLPLLPACLKKERLERLAPAFRFFATAWIVAFTYALFVGVLAGHASAALYSYASFVIPVIAGTWIATQDLPPAATLRRLAIIVVTLGGVVGVYGLLQFASPPPWDVLWVQSADMQSIGPPEPFLMRVFSTLNSPGPSADFMAIVLVLGLSGIGLRGIAMWPLMASILASLTLTLVRSAWIALVAGVVSYLVLSPSRWRSLPIIAAFSILGMSLIVSLPTMLGADRGGSQVVDRLQTFNDLGHDSSALDREAEITDTFDSANNDPIGRGLGIIGAAAKLSNADHEGTPLDSGFLARFYELGYLGFALYLVVVAGSLLTLLRRLIVSHGRFSAEDRVAIATAAALCIVVLALEAAGDSYDGIVGLFAWLAIGIGLHWQFNPLAKKASLQRPARFGRRRLTT